MNRTGRSLALTLMIVVAPATLYATSFVVPTDDELIEKSEAIVRGVVLSGTSVELEPGYVETRYEFAVDEVLKGPMKARSRLTFSSPGGSTSEYVLQVESAAHFSEGDQALLFLTRHRGGWTPTDLTLGKFRFATTSAGHPVLIRDTEDIVGWDRDGRVHAEKVRRETEFLHFVREKVAGRNADATQYEVPASELLAPPIDSADSLKLETNAAGPSHTYAARLYSCDGTSSPARWTTATMAAGISFFKNAAQNASGLGDGGAGVIQNGLGAWTNDCTSAVNITYGGPSAATKTSGDGTNVIVFNDPGGYVPGSWTGSGTIATTFSSAGGTQTFDATTWFSLSDTDIVFQDGYPGTHPTISVAMTHELGHAIGFRHADKSFAPSCTVASGCVFSCNPQSACDGTGGQECASTSIMTASANSGLGFTLQTWDINAATAVYPGGSCATVTPPTSVTATATSSTSVTLAWVPSATATDGYRIYRRGAGGAFAMVGSTGAGATGAVVTVPAGGAYLFKVTGVAGASESPDSNTDLTAAVDFTETIVAGTTTVKASHVNELRTAVTALWALAGLGTPSFTDGPAVIAGITICNRLHVTELRTMMDSARTALGFSAGTYATDPNILANTTFIRKAHIDELRVAAR